MIGSNGHPVTDGGASKFKISPKPKKTMTYGAPRSSVPGPMRPTYGQPTDTYGPVGQINNQGANYGESDYGTYESEIEEEFKDNRNS